ncbi:hypothetical protein [Streptomyces sp. NPDC060002]|uniref:hypothetical protein n=1 Tax=Streptomyces sp. NPDC060002 TaxID=3347033 RepID=UPI0036BC1603
MSTPTEQIQKLKEDLTAEDRRLGGEIKKKVDKEEFPTFFAEERKKEEPARKQAEAERAKSLNKLVADEVEKAGESAWKPDSRWYKTPEFMGFVSGLTGSLIGITVIKYDFAIFDVTEKVNRLTLRLVNFITKRTQWDRQFLTAQQKDERKLNRRFSTIEHRLSRLMKNANKRIGAVELKVARIDRSRSDARGRMGSVPTSPGSIPQAHNAADELNNLHARVDALVAAIG